MVTVGQVAGGGGGEHSNGEYWYKGGVGWLGTWGGEEGREKSDVKFFVCFFPHFLPRSCFLYRKKKKKWR